MNFPELLTQTHDNATSAYGEHKAWSECHKLVKRVIEDDKLDFKIMLNTVPEPSDTEKALWQQATKDYVEMLEELIDGHLEPSTKPFI